MYVIRCAVIWGEWLGSYIKQVWTPTRLTLKARWRLRCVPSFEIGKAFTLPGTARTRIKSRSIRKISRATRKLSTTSEAAENPPKVGKGTGSQQGRHTTTTGSHFWNRCGHSPEEFTGEQVNLKSSLHYLGSSRLLVLLPRSYNSSFVFKNRLIYDREVTRNGSSPFELRHDIDLI